MSTCLSATLSQPPNPLMGPKILTPVPFLPHRPLSRPPPQSLETDPILPGPFYPFFPRAH
jgi:hypothetical protein